MKTVVALFNTFTDAQHAVETLVNADVDRADISMIANDAGGDYKVYTGDYKEGDATASGAVGGAAVGGAIGLLAGLGALAIPGVGPVLAAGPLLSALLGAGVGAATGGIAGALIDVGVSEEEAQYYSEGVRRGGTLLSVTTSDEHVNQVEHLLDRSGAVDIRERAEDWRDRGWEGHHEDAEPYTNDLVQEEANYWRMRGGNPNR
jgi:uncharacterized membrane protein